VIFDCVMIRDELDMLELRLEELDATGAVTVVAEAHQDHQGHPKPLHFAENAARFAGWNDRIRHVVVTGLPDHPNPWVREHAQRDTALAAIEDASDGDLVLIADIDEIPDPGVFELEFAGVDALTLEQNVCAFAVDWAHVPELTSVLTTAGHARHTGSLAKIRDNRGAYPVVHNAGWHFSWLGGPQACLEKTDAFCHLESRDIVRAGIESGDFIERGLWDVAQLKPVDVDSTWPRMIYERRCPESWFRPKSGA
jgi:Glycosyltransferase family 17